VTQAYITARQPSEVAREVERWHDRGCRSFLIRRVNHGGELDRERLGAARYAAGVQSQIELEGESSGVTVMSGSGALGAR
jgi:L-alanine-DL-glutamate epimerase-like enolase superfamily enzyme